MANQRVEQKIGQRVSDRWWPMRQAYGKNADGSIRTLETWVDMRSGPGGGEKTIAYDDAGWNASPPDLPSGDPGREACYQPPSPAYRERFALIDWTK